LRKLGLAQRTIEQACPALVAWEMPAPEPFRLPLPEHARLAVEKIYDHEIGVDFALS
jgi:hypothetical protein